jgi:uncharacterized protein YdeI (YjbR/CyaY-like superfamily)
VTSPEVELHPKDGFPVMAFEAAAGFEHWLEQSAETSPGLWVKIAKKNSGIQSITYDEAVDVALCFGWIDGQKASYDESWFLQRFTPRRARSVWSKVNTGKATALIESGRMRPSGLLEVQRAQADGRWDAAYGGSRDIEVPPELQRFLDANPQAARFWSSLSAANRYAFLWRLHTARRPETRAKRLAQYEQMLLAAETFH